MSEDTYVVVDPETKRRKVVSAEEAKKIHERERKARAQQIEQEAKARQQQDKPPAPPPRQATEGGE